MKEFEFIVNSLIQPSKEKKDFHILDSSGQFDKDRKDDFGIARAINAAFLISLTDGLHPEYESAKEFLNIMTESPRWSEIAKFYKNGIDLIYKEIRNIRENDNDFKNCLRSLFDWISDTNNAVKREETREKIWSVFSPEANDILSNRIERINTLREKRSVTITQLNDKPLSDPAQQILFTSNILLTIPPISKSWDNLFIADNLKERINMISDEQTYWYDHPIQIGVEPEKNEILYGLKGLEQAIEFERGLGNLKDDTQTTCLLSVSVTHRRLHEIAKSYIEHVLFLETLKNIDLYIFTELDARRIVDEVISPAAEHYFRSTDSIEILEMFGVDGEYGRHYSFLKAISAFWSVLIQPDIKACFKIDLDQVFPQKELAEIGSSAFEHFKTPLWGAKGLDSMGVPLDLGMIAGALVNEKDISKSIFMPDVQFPDREISFDEHIFFSILPQALSTEAEMMTRYTDGHLDGKTRCIQRIHVTGGTNGILVDSLRYYRPFTPSFIGRAEDQAYIMSVLFKNGERLAYVHKDGLIMRHDKEAFAQESIQSAHISKLIGDYIRILYFSAYAKLVGDVKEIKDILDPFTGCFISKIPQTVVFLRFAFKAASFFHANNKEGLEFIKIGTERIMDALNFAFGNNSTLKQQYQKEQKGWDLYYNTLSAIEHGLKNDDLFALDLRGKAIDIVNKCNII